MLLQLEPEGQNMQRLPCRVEPRVALWPELEAIFSEYLGIHIAGRGDNKPGENCAFTGLAPRLLPDSNAPPL